MITYRVIVREHGSREVIEEDYASGNTPKTAQAAKSALVKFFDWIYPACAYSITVNRIA